MRTEPSPVVGMTGSPVWGSNRPGQERSTSSVLMRTKKGCQRDTLGAGSPEKTISGIVGGDGELGPGYLDSLLFVGIVLQGRHARTQCVQGRLDSTGQMEFAQNVAHVVAHGRFADH